MGPLSGVFGITWALFRMIIWSSVSKDKRTYTGSVSRVVRQRGLQCQSDVFLPIHLSPDPSFTSNLSSKLSNHYLVLRKLYTTQPCVPNIRKKKADNTDYWLDLVLLHRIWTGDEKGHFNYIGVPIAQDDPDAYILAACVSHALALLKTPTAIQIMGETATKINEVLKEQGRGMDDFDGARWIDKQFLPQLIRQFPPVYVDDYLLHQDATVMGQLHKSTFDKKAYCWGLSITIHAALLNAVIKAKAERNGFPYRIFMFKMVVNFAHEIQHLIVVYLTKSVEHMTPDRMNQFHDLDFTTSWLKHLPIANPLQSGEAGHYFEQRFFGGKVWILPQFGTYCASAGVTWLEKGYTSDGKSLNIRCELIRGNRLSRYCKEVSSLRNVFEAVL